MSIFDHRWAQAQPASWWAQVAEQAHSQVRVGVVGATGRPNVQDCDAADKLLMNSIGKGGASVTVMRPAALGDGDTGKYLASSEGSAAVGVLGRADLSQFMVDNLESKKWENKAVHLYAASGFSCC